MERIRVMHVIARMNVGGPAVEITNLMRGLDPDLFEQRLVTGWCEVDEADYLHTQALDIEAVRLPGLGRTVRPTADLQVLTDLVGQIRAYRPHIVHTHTAKAGALGRVAARVSRTGTRIAHTHHGHLLHGYYGRAKTRAVVALERQLSRVSDRIVTVGDRVRDDLLAARIGRPEQYAVIRSGVRLGPTPDAVWAKQELGLPWDAVIVSMVGRITGIKRPDRFLDVVAACAARDPGIHFMVVGGGDQAEWLRQRVQQQGLPVTLVGWRRDLETVLAATDIALLTSDNEGTPLSLIEAAMAGIPAVATDVGAVAEVVADHRTGILTPPESAALAEAVLVLAREPRLRHTMGQAARDRVSRVYSVEGFVAGHVDLYRSMARQGNGSTHGR